jgi:hypothetical protein
MAQARKVATRRVHAVKATPVVKPVKFYTFADGKRPSAGARLFAFTEAALTFLGLREGKKVSKQAVIALMGPRAVQHHTEAKNFVESGDKIGLSKQGQEKFQSRVDDNAFDAKMYKVYASAIKSGKANPDYGIEEKHLIQTSLPV